ncbi:MAG: hypothetical protein U9N50_04745 [Pseudomonadota bacterium]|nr:hypothetical protein [Pseudomonadota bacterium]
MRFILTLALSLLFSACESIPSASRSPGLHTIPTGSIVKLNRALTIPAQRVRIGVQYGEVIAGVYTGEPYCQFEVNTISETATTLPAGEYRITRVLQYEDPYFSHLPRSKRRVASASEAAAWATQAMSPDSHWTYTTVFRLESRLHPDIRQLVCGSTFPSGYEARHITIREFEILAGDVMTLQVAGK